MDEKNYENCLAENASWNNVDRFDIPTVTIVEKDKPLNDALDNRMLNDISVKRKSQQSINENVISPKSKPITNGSMVRN